MESLFVAAAGMVAAIVADLAASRAGLSRVGAYAASLAVGAATTAGGIVVRDLPPAESCIAVLCYGAWWFSFLNLVQALESSLRARLLNVVRLSGGQIERAALAERYNDSVILGLRLRRLLDSGAVVETAGRYRVASRGLKAIAAFFRLLKLTLMGRVSEFEDLAA